MGAGGSEISQMIDNTRVLEVRATLAKLEWANPHSERGEAQ